MTGIGLIATSVLVVAGTAGAAGASPSWSDPVEMPLADAGGVFAGVSCTDQLDCVAVGYEVTYPNDALTVTPIYAAESNGVWSETSVFSDPRGSGSFSSVSCSGSSHCTAVGSDASGALVVTESNGVWSAPISFKDDGVGLTSVSCSDAVDCTATAGDGYDEPFVVTESNGVWKKPYEIPVPKYIGYLYGISCSSASDCTAVGGAGHGALVVSELGGVWSPARFWNGAGRGATYMSVSCPDASDCTAVGDNDNDHPIYATESHGIWASPTIVRTIGSGQLEGVSCARPAKCTAVGNALNAYPMFMLDSRGTWGTPTELPYEGQGGGGFLGIDCVSVNTCTAAGRGPAPDYPGEPMIATESKAS